MLTYPCKCTVLHCNHLGNTWKPLVLMTRHFDYCLNASEGDNQSVRSSAPMVSRCFPGGYNVKLYISRGRLAWWLLAFLHSDWQVDKLWGLCALDVTWFTFIRPLFVLSLFAIVLMIRLSDIWIHIDLNIAYLIITDAYKVGTSFELNLGRIDLLSKSYLTKYTIPYSYCLFRFCHHYPVSWHSCYSLICINVP